MNKMVIKKQAVSPDKTELRNSLNINGLNGNPHHPARGREQLGEKEPLVK